MRIEMHRASRNLMRSFRLKQNEKTQVYNHNNFANNIIPNGDASPFTFGQAQINNSGISKQQQQRPLDNARKPLLKIDASMTRVVSSASRSSSGASSTFVADSLSLVLSPPPRLQHLSSAPSSPSCESVSSVTHNECDQQQQQQPYQKGIALFGNCLEYDAYPSPPPLGCTLLVDLPVPAPPSILLLSTLSKSSIGKFGAIGSCRPNSRDVNNLTAEGCGCESAPLYSQFGKTTGILNDFYRLLGWEY
ncbi:hypothetical protein HK100_003781 [Physocladia obscura]|uniref:Uncharacterized protein n=1 Tax=Physocladia obscura TaxID=109957 RepID=A0AAD5XA95_9FUNG|nr:hypothetical protein HK100_003781 [Physocladia obscura]